MPMHSPMQQKDMHVCHVALLLLWISLPVGCARVQFTHASFLLLACMNVQVQQRGFMLKALLRAAMRWRDPDDEFGRCRLESESLEDVFGSAAIVEELMANGKTIPFLIEPDLGVRVRNITMHLPKSMNTRVCAEEYHPIWHAFDGTRLFSGCVDVALVCVWL